MTKATVLEMPKGWRVNKQVDTEVDGLYIVMAGEFNFKAGRHCDSDQPRAIKLYQRQDKVSILKSIVRQSHQVHNMARLVVKSQSEQEHYEIRNKVKLRINAAVKSLILSRGFYFGEDTLFAKERRKPKLKNWYTCECISQNSKCIFF